MPQPSQKSIEHLSHVINNCPAPLLPNKAPTLETLANITISSSNLMYPTRNPQPVEPIASVHQRNKTSCRPARVLELLYKAFACYPIFSTIAKFSHDGDIRNFVRVTLPPAEAKAITESIPRLTCRVCFCLGCGTVVCNYVTCVCRYPL